MPVEGVPLGGGCDDLPTFNGASDLFFKNILEPSVLQGHGRWKEPWIALRE